MMKTYSIKLGGLLAVTAVVRADSLERAIELAWSETPAPGESVVYEQAMECFEEDGPEVLSAAEVGEGGARR